MAATSIEQYMLELINRARLDPGAEAARLGMGLNDGLAPGTIADIPLRPLAGNGALDAAARGHSQWMLDTDTFSHTGAGGSSASARMQSAGYTLTSPWATGENIALHSRDGRNLATLIEAQHDALFRSADHRPNILADRFREVGIGQAEGTYRNTSSGAVTQDFAGSGEAAFVTGSIYDDMNGNGFYSVGEGRAGVEVTAGAAGTVTGAEGGYALPAAPDTELRFTRDGFTSVLRADTAAGNVKVDLVNGNLWKVAGNVTLVSGLGDAELLGVAGYSLTGGEGNNLLGGNRGDNALYGQGGNDRIGGNGGNDVLGGGTGNDLLWAGDGNDTLGGDDGNDQAWAGSGDDRSWGGAGYDQLFGDDGNDQAWGGSEDDVVGGGAGHDQLFGEDGNDILGGDDGNDVLGGGMGQDMIWGGSGDDIIGGDEGDDQTWAGIGNDKTWGGAGYDRLFGDDGNDQIYGGGEDDVLGGGAGNDVIFGEDGRDILGGDDGNDSLGGGGGDDRLWGGEGNDWLFGETGQDELWGGSGNDALAGDGGNDLIWGEAGADHFLFGAGGGEDLIMDFSPAEGDRLQLHHLLWDGPLSPAEVIARHGAITPEGIVLDFGEEAITLQGFADMSVLFAHLDIL